MADEQQKDIVQPILTPSEKGESQEVAAPDAALKLVKLDKAQNSLEEYHMTEAVQTAFDSGVTRRCIA